jgi:hypothetical protein
MVLVHNFGQMVPDMKVSGETIKLMAKANLFTLMAMFTKENGSMTKQRVKELIHMQMVHIMKDNG